MKIENNFVGVSLNIQMKIAWNVEMTETTKSIGVNDQFKIYMTCTNIIESFHTHN